MLGRPGESVMVIVPAFAPGDGGNQCIVSRIVTQIKTAAAPDMRYRIDHPGKVPAYGDTKNDRPHDHCPTANCEQSSSQYERRDVIIVIQKPQIRIFHQVGRITLFCRLRLILRGSLKYPAHMRPPNALLRAVRIFVRVGESVVQTVRRHPSDRAGLQTERAAGREKTHHPFGRRKSAMRQ